MTTVSPPWAYALSLPHDPLAPRIARTTLRAVLDGHGMRELTDTAELLACELVTNAYLHSDGPSSIRVRSMSAHRLRVSVWDTNPVIPSPFDRPVPTPVPPPLDADCGRGLFLVGLCADSWGGYRLGDDIFGVSGKMLWFELDRCPGAYAIAA